MVALPRVSPVSTFVGGRCSQEGRLVGIEKIGNVRKCISTLVGAGVTPEDMVRTRLLRSLRAPHHLVCPCTFPSSFGWYKHERLSAVGFVFLTGGCESHLDYLELLSHPTVLPLPPS